MVLKYQNMEPYITNIPSDNLIESALDRIDYLDAFAIRIPAIYEVSLPRLVKSFFYTIPTWCKLLLGLREVIAGMIGLKTASKVNVEEQLRNFSGTPGESIALFHVKGRSEKEILTSEEDKHLDFCLSFFGERKDEEFEITLATTVKINGWLGKVYWFFVKPFHKILVPVMLKRIAKHLQQRYELASVSK